MDEQLRLKSVNWTTGMLLSPQHFRRQEAFLEESVTWLLQYCLSSTGLVGPGVRIPPGARGLAKFDPRVELVDTGRMVQLAVIEARGVTGSGLLVDLSGDDVVRHVLPRSELAGLTEAQVYVVVGEDREEDPGSVGSDDANPAQAAYRRAAYRVQIGIDADTLHRALCVGRIQRASETAGFELDAQFIPSCATMLGHSQLYASWKSLQAAMVQLATDYAQLYRDCAAYITQVSQRIADVSHDRDVLAFIERAVLGIDQCAYECFDPTIAPAAFFRSIDRAGRRVALALDLSERTRQYFADLGQADSDYSAMLEEERTSLEQPRDFGSTADLKTGILAAERTVRRLRRLGDALDARYTDYRLSRSVESLKFLLDGEGEKFFMAVMTPTHPQRRGEVLTFAFGQLNLSGRQSYRVVLIADQNATPWQAGEGFRLDVMVNPGSSNDVISGTVACVLPAQRNFSFDFEAHEATTTISSLQVTVQPGSRIRACILYQRRLGMRSLGGATVAPPGQPPRRSTPPPRQDTATPPPHVKWNKDVK